MRFINKSEIKSPTYKAIIPLLDTMRDAHIAKRVECSREYVRQVRREHANNKQG